MTRVYLIRGGLENVHPNDVPQELIQEIEKPHKETLDIRPAIITAFATVLAAYLLSRKR